MATRYEAENEPRTEKGASLARGPALILGTILLAAGLYFIYKQHYFPKFSEFPSGKATVKGKVLFGLFGGNGWTGMLTAICGGLLLFGAAQHLLAKTMSLIVGVVLGGAAIIGLLNHSNVLGLVSANHLTELAWGIAAVILLFNTLIPRRTRTIEPAYAGGREGRRGGGGRVAAGAAAGAGAGAVAEHEHDRHRERRAADEAPAGERGDRVGGERGHGGRHAAEAAAAGAGAGALAEHEHDRHRQERDAERRDAEAAGAEGRAVEGQGAAGQGEPVADRGAGGAVNERGAGQPVDERGAGEPVNERGAGEPVADRSAQGQPAAAGSQDATSVQDRQGAGAGARTGNGGNQGGLAERAKRWLRPGSGN